VWYSLLLVGVGAALAGLAATAVALRFVGRLPADYYAVFYLTAPLAALLVGPSLWWWAIIKPGRLSVRRGIGVGVLAASLAHPLAWYIALVLTLLMGERTIGGITGGVNVNNPVQDVFASLVLAGFSLIYVGWITALIGGVGGGVVALLQSVSGCTHRWHAALTE
jgi:hypothetical protein